MEVMVTLCLEDIFKTYIISKSVHVVPKDFILNFIAFLIGQNLKIVVTKNPYDNSKIHVEFMN